MDPGRQAPKETPKKEDLFERVRQAAATYLEQDGWRLEKPRHNPKVLSAPDPRARCCCGELESELGLLAQLEALARPDYPEDGDGLRTAFAFALRAADSRVAPRWGAAGPGDGRVLGWSPRRTRLVAPGAGFERFVAALNQLPYQLLLRHERSELLAWPAFNEATAECEVVARVWPAPSHELPHGTQPWRDFTFRLRCVEEGPHKGCWMTRHVETPWDTRNYV